MGPSIHHSYTMAILDYQIDYPHHFPIISPSTFTDLEAWWHGRECFPGCSPWLTPIQSCIELYAYRAILEQTECGMNMGNFKQNPL